MSNIYGHQNFVAVPNKEKIEQCLFLLKKEIFYLMVKLKKELFEIKLFFKLNLFETNRKMWTKTYKERTKN